MNGPNTPPGPGAVLPLLKSLEDVVAFFAGVADLDATGPASPALEDGVRLVELSPGPVAAACRVLGNDGDPPPSPLFPPTVAA